MGRGPVPSETGLSREEGQLRAWEEDQSLQRLDCPERKDSSEHGKRTRPFREVKKRLDCPERKDSSEHGKRTNPFREVKKRLDCPEREFRVYEALLPTFCMCVSVCVCVRVFVCACACVCLSVRASVYARLSANQMSRSVHVCKLID
jgi:hypothetical protein